MKLLHVGIYVGDDAEALVGFSCYHTGKASEQVLQSFRRGRLGIYETERPVSGDISLRYLFGCLTV